jgi:uncharacterized DUF497 family protein
LLTARGADYDRWMDFEWDTEKAPSNLAKHGVSFQEAATIFGNPLAITFADTDHSESEDRFLTFGRSGEGHLLVVSHTDRANRTRIISALPPTRKETKIYESG